MVTVTGWGVVPKYIIFHHFSGDFLGHKESWLLSFAGLQASLRCSTGEDPQRFSGENTGNEPWNSGGKSEESW